LSKDGVTIQVDKRRVKVKCVLAGTGGARFPV
jgi:hypothetical protein